MNHKLRYLSGVLTVMCCMAVSLFPASAGHYSSSETAQETPPAAIETITISKEEVERPKKQETLTPQGNLDLVDDVIEQSTDSEKDQTQFITVQSRDGHYFYIVIDRTAQGENVHLLNQVDESDLMALLGDGESMEEPAPPAVCSCEERCAMGSINTECAICITTMRKCAGEEPEPEQKPDPAPEVPEQQEKPQKPQNSNVLLLVPVLLVLGGGAIYFYAACIRDRKKPDTAEPDPDDYELEEHEVWNGDAGDESEE